MKLLDGGDTDGDKSAEGSACRDPIAGLLDVLAASAAGAGSLQCKKEISELPSGAASSAQGQHLQANFYSDRPRRGWQAKFDGART